MIISLLFISLFVMTIPQMIVFFPQGVKPCMTTAQASPGIPTALLCLTVEFLLMQRATTVDLVLQ